MEVIDVRASQNTYLHKDFHIAMNTAIEYLSVKYGEDAVKDYLTEFARSFYAPLIRDINARGLIAMKEHYERIYSIENQAIEIEFNEDELSIYIPACPAVTHIMAVRGKISPLFVETTRTVNEAICECTSYSYDLVEYDSKTGRSTQIFRSK